MTFSAKSLLAEFAELEKVAGATRRYVIALSGGLDSSALAHAIGELLETSELTQSVLAVHVDHGLQAQSAEWCRQCESDMLALGIEYRPVRVQLGDCIGISVEAAAREARYCALQAQMESGDWLLTAHHREDQAETLLQNMIRGSGPAGIAGIAGIRRLGPGWLARPLLDTSREALRQYASAKGVQWIDDPSNLDTRFDRNFLRHKVMPVLRDRWPDITSRLYKSARHASEAAGLLADLAEIDLADVGGRPERLPIDRLLRLTTQRQRNLLRHAIRILGLATPTEKHLQIVLSEVIAAREDAEPLVSWPGASVRRYRDGLYLLPETMAERLRSTVVVSGSVENLGTGLGSLQFEPGASIGFPESLLERGISIRSREGGEEFRPEGQVHTRKLKKLLQEEGIVPWMRNRIPLIYADEQLVAVGDLWLSADVASRPGVAVHWNERPALH